MIKNNKKNNINLICLLLFSTYSIIVILIFKDILFNKETLISWLGYLFTVITFIITITINNELFNENTKSVFNSLPLSITIISYLILQIIVSLIIIPFVNSNFEVIISIEVIILALFLIITILLLKSREYIENIDEKNENQISFIKSLKKEIAILNIKFADNKQGSDEIIDNNDFHSIKSELEELKDLVRYSNPMSNDKTRQIEENILKNLSELKIELKNHQYQQAINLIKLIKKDIIERDIIL